MVDQRLKEITSMNEKRLGTVGLLDILLAGWLAAGLALIIVEVCYVVFNLSATQPSFALVLAFNILPQLLGGTTATYFLTRKARVLSTRNAIMLGLLSSVLYTVMTGEVGIYSIVAFIAGSYMGALLLERIRRSLNLSSSI